MKRMFRLLLCSAKKKASWEKMNFTAFYSIRPFSMVEHVVVHSREKRAGFLALGDKRTL
jgi:hypothetical protein